MRLLLVDAQILFGDGLSALLSSQPGFTVLGRASSLAQAVAMCTELKPDLVLTDARLPDGRGAAVVSAILRVHPSTRVVFLTMDDDDEVLYPALHAGAQGFLLKSTCLSDLVNFLRRAEGGEPVFSPSIMARLLNAFAHMPAPRPAEENCVDLTAREIEVLAALGSGATNREIARLLTISEFTVKNHVRNILVKLNVHTRSEARAFARAGLR